MIVFLLLQKSPLIWCFFSLLGDHCTRSSLFVGCRNHDHRGDIAIIVILILVHILVFVFLLVPLHTYPHIYIIFLQINKQCNKCEYMTYDYPSIPSHAHLLLLSSPQPPLSKSQIFGQSFCQTSPSADQLRGDNYVRSDNNLLYTEGRNWKMGLVGGDLRIIVIYNKIRLKN